MSEKEQNTQNKEKAQGQMRVDVQQKPSINDNAEEKKKVMIRRKQRKPQHENDKRRRREDDEFEKRVISIRRVARTYEGGKRMRISVAVVIGDKKGMVGVGTGSGIDVKVASEKAYNDAKTNMVKVPITRNTICHEFLYKKGAAKIFMKPAAPGTGVVAGGSLRAVFEVVGVKDVLTKMIGTNNPILNAYATVEALSKMKEKKVIDKKL